MKGFQRLFYTIVISFVTLNLIAQTENQYKDKFTLKNFATIYGQLTEIRSDTLFLELENGKTSYLMLKDIRDFKQYGIENIPDSKYSSIYMRNLLDKEKRNFFQMSSAFSYAPGSLSSEIKYLRRYHPHHFLTATYGIEIVTHHYNTVFHPLTIGHQSILYTKGNTPFINANIGYGFAHFTGNSTNFTENVTGGLRLSAGIGMLFRAGENTMFKTGVELVRQLSKEYIEAPHFQRETQISSNRVLFSIGLIF